ncbi:unnamed protein product [Rhizophagus irregularis]|nr:unnamed protein product [Rhizophagus irregularis]
MSFGCTNTIISTFHTGYSSNICLVPLVPLQSALIVLTVYELREQATNQIQQQLIPLMTLPYHSMAVHPLSGDSVPISQVWLQALFSFTFGILLNNLSNFTFSASSSGIQTICIHFLM